MKRSAIGRRDSMRRRILRAAALLVGVLPATGWSQETEALCDQHPLIERALVERARSEQRGLREVYQETLSGRLNQGLEVQLTLDAGGGDCPGATTARGKAAAAVGALLYSGQLHCSGVLVAPSTVLTAGHCVFGFDLAKMEFVVGEDSQQPIQRAGILRADRHQQYDRSRMGVNDLAYLHLNRLVTEVQPVEYQRAALKSQPQRLLMHVGYGIAGAVPGRRRCVNIPIHAACDHAFSTQTPGLNTCRGDSGGGVFYDDGSEIRLTGITNWGDELCRDFGVSLDVGAYPDWIGSRIWEGTRDSLLPAPIERNARKPANPPRIEAIRAALNQVPIWQRKEFFDTHFLEKWITWEARMQGFPATTRLRYPDSCDVFLKNGEVAVLLLGLQRGCDLRDGFQIAFEGSLFSYGEDYFEIRAPELTREVQRAAVVGEYHLLALAKPRILTERRTHDFRLESHHGDWSGRLENCQPVRIDGDWQIDRSQPIGVAIAYQNHGGLAGEPRILAGQELCVPLWAEGFGGFRLGGVPVDAGNKGVISGSVSFTVLRQTDPPNPDVVSSGNLAAGTPLRIPLVEPAREYELRLKLRDGREIVARHSLQAEGVVVTWDSAASTIQVAVD